MNADKRDAKNSAKRETQREPFWNRRAIEVEDREPFFFVDNRDPHWETIKRKSSQSGRYSSSVM